MDLQLIDVDETDSMTTIKFGKLGKGLLTVKAISELTHVFHYIEDESKCKFVIFRGSKECFCRGLDINNFYPSKIDYDGFRKWEQLLRTLHKLNKITIAVVEGDCFGAATDLMLTCDIRIAADEARFSHDEVKKGILPGQTTFQLGKYCGLGRMLELIQTGKIYTAREAVEMGIINGSHNASEIEETIANAMGEYESVNIDMLMLTRRLSRESYSIIYDDFIGSYLAAQHRVISRPAVAGSVDHDEADIM